jgi:hypothetical protein
MKAFKYNLLILKKSKILYEVYFLLFVFMLCFLNVYTEPDDGLLRPKRVYVAHILVKY